MKNILNISIVFLLLIVSACGNFDDMNIDPKAPQSADSGHLFASATKTLVDWKSSTSVNYNVMRLAAQYWSQVTYTSESRYEWDGRQVADNMWMELYSRTLSDLEESRKLANENLDIPVRDNQLAQITVLEVYAFQILVDAFGDVPYTEAFAALDNASPAYDDDETIYGALIEKLDEAIEMFDTSAGSFTTQDLIYSGDVSSWVAFANSLKMRFGVRLLDANPTLGSELITQAANGAFTSNTQNAKMSYVANEVVTGNPMYNQLVVSGRTDYVGSNTLVDILNELNDPRRGFFLETSIDSTDYVGLAYGKIASSNYRLFSTVGSMLKESDFPGVLMSYSEVEFILAEAAARGIAVSGTAEDHYNAAVTASIMDWGGSATDAADYLAQPEVALATAESGNVMNAIAIQKWISLYNEADQGYAEWRRLDYPVFNPPVDMEYSDIPVRYKYPVNESSINASSYERAVQQMGGDTQHIKVFWDLN